MDWLSPDSRFMQAWSNMTDGIIINLYMIVTSVPIVTIGASITAGNVAARKVLQGEGRSVTREYFSAFAKNFVKSTLLWLPYLVLGALVLYLWLFVRIEQLLIAQFALSIIWILGFEWTFAVQARFENSVAGTLKNSLIFSVTHYPYTLALVAIDAVFVALVVATIRYMPPVLFLIIVCGYGSMLMLHVPFTERVFKKYGA